MAGRKADCEHLQAVLREMDMANCVGVCILGQVSDASAESEKELSKGEGSMMRRLIAILNYFS